MKNSDSPFRVGILIYQCRCVYPYLNDECKVRDYFRNWQISYGKNVFYLLFFTNTLPEANHSVSHWRQVSRLKGNYRASPYIDLAVVGKAFPFQSAEFQSLATGNSKQFFFCNNNSLITSLTVSGSSTNLSNS